MCSLLYACDHTFPPRYSALLSLCSTGLWVLQYQASQQHLDVHYLEDVCYQLHTSFIQYGAVVKRFKTTEVSPGGQTSPLQVATYRAGSHVKRKIKERFFLIYLKFRGTKIWGKHRNTKSGHSGFDSCRHKTSTVSGGKPRKGSAGSRAADSLARGHRLPLPLSFVPAGIWLLWQQEEEAAPGPGRHPGSPVCLQPEAKAYAITLWSWKAVILLPLFFKTRKAWVYKLNTAVPCWQHFLSMTSVFAHSDITVRSNIIQAGVLWNAPWADLQENKGMCPSGQQATMYSPFNTHCE